MRRALDFDNPDRAIAAVIIAKCAGKPIRLITVLGNYRPVRKCKYRKLTDKCEQILSTGPKTTVELNTVLDRHLLAITAACKRIRGIHYTTVPGHRVGDRIIGSTIRWELGS